jgi:hypothetical protein
MRKLIIVFGAIATLMAANSFANAGGLFGEGGLIRGDVGRIMKVRLVVQRVPRQAIGSTSAPPAAADSDHQY